MEKGSSLSYGLARKSIRKQPVSGLPRIRAQVTLELVGSLIICVLLISGLSRVFVWLNRSLVERQERYQSTRTNPRGNINNFYTPPRLNIFPQE